MAKFSGRIATNLEQRRDDRIQNVASALLVILLDGADPAGVIVAVRDDEHLELLLVPLATPVPHIPSLFPRSSVAIIERNLVIQRLGGDFRHALADLGL